MREIVYHTKRLKMKNHYTAVYTTNAILSFQNKALKSLADNQRHNFIVLH